MVKLYCLIDNDVLHIVLNNLYSFCFGPPLIHQSSLLSKEKSLNVASGNVNPEEMDVILSTFPLKVFQVS